MINGLEGIPGSGKSYEAVVFHVLPALQSGRLVITNLPLNVEAFAALDPAFRSLIQIRRQPAPILGTWDAERMQEDDKGNISGNAFELWPEDFTEEQKKLAMADYVYENPAASPGVSRRKKNRPSVFGSVWDYYTPWKHPVSGRGPLFVIDEAHNPMPKNGTDQDVIDFYKLHRHFNCDILLADQSFRECCPSITVLLAMMIRVRKADILGKKDCYIRKVYGGFRGAVISTEERPYQPQFFPLYKSHTQGNSVVESTASDVKPLYVKFRNFTRGFWGFTIICCIAATWFILDRKSAKPPVPVAHAAVSSSVASAPRLAGSSPVAGKAVVPRSGASAPVDAAEAEKLDTEPLKGKQVHISGWLKGAKRTIYAFAVSSGGVRQFDIVSSDLERSGYQWKPLGECMGYLLWEGKTRVVSCDSPAIADGRQNTPVVVDMSSGKTSGPQKTL